MLVTVLAPLVATAQVRPNRVLAPPATSPARARGGARHGRRTDAGRAARRPRGREQRRLHRRPPRDLRRHDGNRLDRDRAAGARAAGPGKSALLHLRRVVHDQERRRRPGAGAVDVYTWFEQPQGPQVGKISDQGYGNPALAPGGRQTWTFRATLAQGSYVLHLVIDPKHLNKQYAVNLKPSCGYGGIRRCALRAPRRPRRTPPGCGSRPPGDRHRAHGDAFVHAGRGRCGREQRSRAPGLDRAAERELAQRGTGRQPCRLPADPVCRREAGRQVVARSLPDSRFPAGRRRSRSTAREGVARCNGR